MSGYIDLGLDGFQRDVQALEEKFRKMDKEVQDRIAKEVVAEAGQIFLEEQKRLLASAPNPKYHQFADWLKLWTYKDKSGWHVHVGYPTEVIREHIGVLIVEFGRPGKKGKKKGGKDSLGRKIGKVEPYSHVVASMFLKREEVMEEVKRRFYEEIEKIWNE